MKEWKTPRNEFITESLRKEQVGQNLPLRKEYGRVMRNGGRDEVKGGVVDSSRQLKGSLYQRSILCSMGQCKLEVE